MKMKPLNRRARPQGAVALGDEPPLLSPAIRRLELAKDRFDVRFILDDVPASIYGPLAAYLSARPARFNQVVVSEVVRIAGTDRIRQVVGKQRAGNVLKRYGQVREGALATA